MAEFSMHLNDDQIQIKDWIHQFAVEHIRPHAQEWDDREEFPWPIVQEASKIGLYGFEFLMNAMADPSGLTMPVAIEEIFWAMPVSVWPSWVRVWPQQVLAVTELPSK